MTTSAMLTARVPADVKERAAENLAQMGYTTSQAVQFIWQYLADVPVNEGKRFLEPAANKEDDEKQRRLRAFEESKKLIMTPERFRELHGVERSAEYKPMDLDEARELRYEERMAKLYGEDF